jgi:hypothetical protein
MPTVWTGTPPCFCDVCNDVIADEFVDGKVYRQEAWAIMCPSCHREKGCGCGTGRGQRFKLQGADWVKVEG